MRNFIIALVFAIINSILVAFAPFPYVASRVTNTLQVVSSVIAGYLYLIICINLLEFARTYEPEVSKSDNSIRSNTILKFNVIFAYITLIFSFIFEFFIAGETNDYLTPSSIHIQGNTFLLASRLLSGSYIIVVQLLAIFYLNQIIGTDYGSRLEIRIRTWSAIIFFVFSTGDTLANIVATTVIFFLGKEAQIEIIAISTYKYYDDWVIYPLLIFVLLAIGPNWLVRYATRLLERTIYWYQIGDIRWLRNFLIREVPQVFLKTDLGRDSALNMGQINKFLITRMVIECSDAISLLTPYLSYEEWSQITNEASLQRKNNYEIEALIILKAIKKKRTGFQPYENVQEKTFAFPTLMASSIFELVKCYYRVSRYMQSLNDKNIG